MATAGVSLCSEIEDYTPEQLKTMVSTEINRATQSQSPSDLSPAILLVRDGSIETRTICRQPNGAARHQGQHQEQQQQQQTKVRQEVKKSDQQPQQPRRQPRHRCIRFWTAVVVVALLAVIVGVVLKEHVCKGNCPGAIGHRQFSMTPVLHGATPVPMPEPTVSASTTGNHQFMCRIRVVFRTEVLYLASPSSAIVTEGGGSMHVALTRNVIQALVFRLETLPNNARRSEYGFRVLGTDYILHRPATARKEERAHCLRVSLSPSGQLSEKKNLLRLTRVPDDDQFENYRQPLLPLFHLISRRHDGRISACTGDNKTSTYFAIDEIH